jgi:alkanesulfonate monooxygenase SsuD/methylene tetrahydromethanopterin reductase-like flavin-dependent oxidoreductase (luciferase family)
VSSSPRYGRTSSRSAFGYDLNDYSELFADKLDLLLKLRAENPVTWPGTTRPTLHEADVSPQPEQDPAMGGGRRDTAPTR